MLNAQTVRNASRLSEAIEHTNLSPNATSQDIRKLCLETGEFRFKRVCVSPYRTSEAVQLLKGTQVQIVTVVGFPLGYAKVETKAQEAIIAVADGATELDMVANIGALKDRTFNYTVKEISTVANIAHNGSAKLKVIIEAGVFSPEEIKKACGLAEEAGSDFVKMGTGFGPRGVTVEDVRIMHEAVGDRLGIKAAGGIRSADQALELLKAGASRIGSSSGPDIMKSFKANKRSVANI